MTEKQRHPLLEVIRYVDGVMTDAERAEFEGLMRKHPELAREVEIQQRIGSSLRQAVQPRDVFTSGKVSNLVGRAGKRGISAERPSVIARIGIAKLAGIAAAILVVAGVGWFLLSQMGSAPPVAPTQVATPKVLEPRQVYVLAERRNFLPEWKCETDEEFAAAVRDRLGQALLVAPAETALSVIGWAYGDNYDAKVLGEKTMILYTKYEDQGVIVMIDRTEEDRPLEAPPDTSGLHLFKRTIGDLVLYEVSPFADEHVLPHFFDPDASVEPSEPQSETM